MVLAREKIDNTYAMKEYRIASFDGKATQVKREPRKQSDWNKSEGNSFIDFYSKSRQFVPPPNQYKDVENGYGYKIKSPFLYKAARTTEFQRIMD